jgi:hypothetical protein
LDNWIDWDQLFIPLLDSLSNPGSLLDSLSNPGSLLDSL